MNIETERDKRRYLSMMLYKARKRAKTKEMPCDIDIDYLCSIAPDICPVFGYNLMWT